MGKSSQPMSNASVSSRNTYYTNLDTALRRLRHKDRPRILWVDAICINQNDEIEKGSQVQIMQQIYANAGQVIVWLGEEDENDGSPFDSVNLVSSLLDKAQEHGNVEFYLFRRDKLDFQGDFLLVSPAEGTKQLQEALSLLAKLLRRDWFRRTWTVQEVASSKKAILMCGTKTMPWNLFADVCLRYQDRQRAVRQVEKSYPGRQIGYDSDSKHIQSSASRIRPTGFNILEDSIVKQSLENIVAIEHVRQSQTLKTPVTLFEVLLATSFNACSDMRDKVYGVLGLAHDYSEIGGLNPDYDKQTTVRDVFTKFALWDIQHSGKLRILSCAVPPYPRIGSSTLDTPSWVPPWGFIQNTHPFARYSQKTGFKAGGDSSAKFSVVDNSVLEVVGKEVDRVSRVGPVFDDAKKMGVFSLDYGYSQDVYQVRSWLKKCQALAGGGVNPKTPDHFWRTMTCGLTGTGVPAPPEYRYIFAKYLQFVDALCEISQRRHDLMSANRLPTGFTEQDITNFALIESSISRWSSKRKICLTANGRLACMPRESEPGDLICILHGGDVPYVLRSISGDRDGYVVIGECFVDGLMHGEASGSIRGKRFKDKKFRLH